MKGILCTLATLVIIGWAIGYFGYHEGGFFHLILLVGVTVMVIQLIAVRR